ncbi:MAG TPA: DMT family transporter [Anaerolineales bacterium]|nr:DMT family transporter [Anaerolineales bacterium]
MDGATAAILFGLGSALAWGAGDFIGGFASRHTNPLAVIVISQMAGLGMLVLAAVLSAEPISSGRDLAFGALSGLAGVVGIVALYRGLAEHKMGTIAPLAALMTALLPIIAGTIQEGFPKPAQVAGILIAAPAIYWVSRDDRSTGPLSHLSWEILKYPLVAGLGFGLFFILLDRVSTGAVYWPIVATRSASIAAVVLWTLASGGLRIRAGTPAGAAGLPGFLLPWILLGGVFDAGGNVFFALATQAGRLDIAAVLASLFPAGTVFLAWLVLKERLSGTQWLGVAAAFVSVILFSI